LIIGLLEVRNASYWSKGLASIVAKFHGMRASCVGMTSIAETNSCNQENVSHHQTVRIIDKLRNGLQASMANAIYVCSSLVV
jgi:hypothetical protein